MGCDNTPSIEDNPLNNSNSENPNDINSGEEFKDFDPAGYAKKTFGMFSGRDAKVKIEIRNDLVGVFIDRFGKDIPLYPADRDGYSVTMVDVSVSNQFYGWLFGLGDGVRIVSPESVADGYKKEMQKVMQLY